MNRILMVDDDARFLEVYSEILCSSGYDTITANSGQEALSTLDNTYCNMAIIDVLMPEMTGIELIKRIKQKYPTIIVMMLTGEGSIKGAVEAMEQGAFTYMLKPIEPKELIQNIKRAETVFRLESENLSLKNRIEGYEDNFELVGDSDFLKKLRENIKVIAKTNSTVLITGESGTGKEIIANMIHRSSNRSNGPFVTVNCGAIPSTIAESELFGHEKGAFTGAQNRKIGKFELSNGGTLLLDEIGDMPLDIQKKLLRVLQEKSFERVGGNDTIHSDFRLICATNKNLEDEIEKGRFREDLYYRINILPVETIPVRDRKEDIPILFEYYYQMFCREMNKTISPISNEAKEELKLNEWRGNGREIKNMAERMAVFSSGNEIVSLDIRKFMGFPSYTSPYYVNDLKQAGEMFEKEFIIRQLRRNDNNVAKAAETMGITRQTLYNKIEKLDIEM